MICTCRLGRRAFLASACGGLLTASAFVGEASATADPDLASFVKDMPKLELHLHIEGTLEPEMKFRLAKRNNITLPEPDVEAIYKSYGAIHDLQSFLTIFYAGQDVLRQRQDFYDLCYAYLQRASRENVVYVEMSFDPQAHVARGVAFADVVNGLGRAQDDARRDFGIESALIMCFERERSEQSAMEMLHAALPFRNRIIGVGLDSNETNNPPIKFQDVFRKARAEGFRLTMHCDIDQLDTHEHIRQAIDVIKVDRIDHGGNVLERPDLVRRARAHDLTFTVCPVASGWLRKEHAQPVSVVRGMIDAGLKASINSDDPAYMHNNYTIGSTMQAVGDAHLTKADLIALSRNSIMGAWTSDPVRDRQIRQLDAFARSRGV
ncbi:adenosine deaminase [Acetobacteraceae bacterium KSS8]|uniref:Adenine deaminase n=1 Tax=Endosaccharibacter trunci TaxID=2812733 RepID=A0ABT1W5G2_9PROT|nr:adenosine deaminase [Acetobacteraceae bacterium KSS8]